MRLKPGARRPLNAGPLICPHVCVIHPVEIGRGAYEDVKPEQLFERERRAVCFVNCLTKLLLDIKLGEKALSKRKPLSLPVPAIRKNISGTGKPIPAVTGPEQDFGVTEPRAFQHAGNLA